MPLQFVRRPLAQSAEAEPLPDPPSWIVQSAPEPEPPKPKPEGWWSRMAAMTRGFLRGAGGAKAKPPPHLLLLPPGQTTAPVPSYVCDAAREAGIDLTQFVWTPARRRAAPAAGATFFAQSTVEPGDHYVLKVAWHVDTDAALHCEHRALRALSARAPIPRTAFPRAAFFARRDGVALSGQQRLEGEPFRERTDGSPSCARAERAFERLVDIGAGTFRPRDALPFADPLNDLVERFAARFGAPERTKQFLRTQAELVASAGSVPTVLQHGDPAADNLLVTRDHDVAFVGWERCDLEGLPLLDLYWFADSYGQVSAAKSASAWDAEAFAERYLDRTLYSVLLSRAVAASCDRLALSPRLVEPLFHLAWAARAVRNGEGARYAQIVERSVVASLSGGGLSALHG